jgi:hypothetical protein
MTQTNSISGKLARNVCLSFCSAQTAGIVRGWIARMPEFIALRWQVTALTQWTDIIICEPDSLEAAREAATQSRAIVAVCGKLPHDDSSLKQLVLPADAALFASFAIEVERQVSKGQWVMWGRSVQPKSTKTTNT